ncbi:MAG: deoxyribodipyrimidine photo-lyase, partial [Vicinamibacterales bacterium]
MVPAIRIRALNDAPIRPDASHVLYWMIANRRAGWNFALERAADQARALGRPLIVLEALRAGHRWASRRFHQFVLDGMADNRRAFAARGVTYHAYFEPAPGAGAGLLEALAATAALVVTDDFPYFFLPRMTAAAARRLPVRLESVDANGLLPLRAVETA